MFDYESRGTGTMKLAETIEECIKLIIDEIEGYDFYINEYEDRIAYSNSVEEWKEEKKKWENHLENLKLLKVNEKL
jgi:K+/H+ antiporter YhaU regulatory subunit KhtT